ncbi:hypothetical protein [Treponema succinifaciens]|uniref:Lipoprotein n=1 Tax=Treponema succinifaciens (strain ATCC 33096 / DSM 2489 / 6091) TaxID=869209 RepID=F2NV26_TRES6|nr:hypothetical protein [Treponema succinifaciens]AEB13130.1 hypothetical protein Tresu_0165 [Treponema succinifaciens DSM 2489]
MRKFAKISAVLAAMVLALAFVGCKDDDDDPSVVTTWAISEEGYKAVLTFYDNGTAKLEGSDEEGGFSETGKYSGDTTKDGEIVIFYDDGETGTAVIKTESGKTYLKWDYETYSKQ